MPTRTAEKVRDLNGAIQEDIGEVVGGLKKWRAVLSDLEPEVRVINGLASTLKGAGQQLDKLIGDLESEMEAVEKKMLGQSRPEIVQTVNPTLVESAREAKR